MPDAPYFVGVDVGTGSVRAALFDGIGQIVAMSVREISLVSPQPDHYVQSSSEIWTAVCSAVAAATRGVNIEAVKGIGFDATCSLVVLDSRGDPLVLSDNSSREAEVGFDVIVWMDHRAVAEAEHINRTCHEVLRYVGGKISPEMAMPKLLWLKRNLAREKWNKIGHLFELPDFLSWKATGDESRSTCSVVCKWNYQLTEGLPGFWDKNFLKELGLEELLSENAQKIGSNAKEPGTPSGSGLTLRAAEALGLNEGTAVATSLIDAHAGGLGLFGCKALSRFKMAERLPLITGTSSCHMAISRDPIFVPGVWGPYFSSIVSGFWTNEAGQSAAGSLLDRIVQGHSASEGLLKISKESGSHPHDELNRILRKLRNDHNLEHVEYLTQHLHFWPDFHGNRSPLANPALKGMIMGLNLSSDLDDLALQYLATIQSLAYGTKHIIAALEKSGHKIKVLPMCGGLSKNDLFVQTHADVVGLPVILPDTSESVLLGAAMLGAKAAGKESMIDVMNKMGGDGTEIKPRLEVKKFHDAKYEVFLKMVKLQEESLKVMRLWGETEK